MKSWPLFVVVILSVFLAACDGGSDCTPGMVTSPSGQDCAASNPANQPAPTPNVDQALLNAAKVVPGQLAQGVKDASNTSVVGLVTGDTGKLTSGKTVNPLSPCPGGVALDAWGDCPNVKP